MSMLESPRIENPAPWYHVMNRGAAHQTIFHDATYYHLFLRLLEDVLQTYQVEVHAYCLMSNHYHLLVRAEPENLSEAMRYMNGMFARKHNYLRDRDGHLFRGRYKAILVDKQSYYLHLTRYIHLNPVAAKICPLPEQYPWSSYQYYIQKNRKPIWLFCETILDNFQPGNSIENYKRFVLEGIKSDLKTLSLKKKKFIFPKTYNIDIGNNNIKDVNGGDDFGVDFTADVESDVNTHGKADVNLEYHDVPTVLDTQGRISMVNRILDIIADYFNVNPLIIRTNKLRSLHNYPRKISIYLLSRIYLIDRKIILDIIQGLSNSGITKICQRMAIEMEKDKELEQELQNVKSFCEKHLDIYPIHFKLRRDANADEQLS